MRLGKISSIILLAIGYLLWYTRADAQSYLSKVYSEKTNTVLLVHTADIQESMHDIFNRLESSEIAFKIHLRGADAFAILCRTQDPQEMEQIKGLIVEKTKLSTFKTISIQELDRLIDQESKVYHDGRSLLPVFFANKFDQSKTTILLVKVTNPDRDYPRLIGVKHPLLAVQTYMDSRKAYIVMLNSRDADDILEAKARIAASIPDAVFDIVPTLLELDLLFAGIN